MGCSCSADKQTSTRVEPAISPTFVYDRRPKISVRIGDQARKLSVSPQVIFIFGEYDREYVDTQASQHTTLVNKIIDLMIDRLTAKCYLETGQRRMAR